MVTLDTLKNNPVVKVFIKKGNEFLGVLGYTEHGLRHAELVSLLSKSILAKLGYEERMAELGAIAGYLHDIGNVVAREEHGTSAAMMVFQILQEYKMDPEEMAVIMSAISVHEDHKGNAVNEVAAALILADKSDVHRSRVRNADISTFDVHDRVNYAVEKSQLIINEVDRTITLKITIDTQISSAMEYFEIFLTRMIMCRKAAQLLKCEFHLEINGAMLL